MKSNLTRLLYGILLASTFGLLTSCAGVATLDEATQNFSDKKFVEARRSAQKTLAQNQDNPETLALYGWSEFMLDNFSVAQGAFRKVEELDPNSFNAHMGLGWTHLKLGNFDDAEKYFEKAAISAQPFQEYLVVDAQAWLALRQGKLDEAEDLFKSEESLFSEEVVSAEGEIPADNKVGLGWVALRRNDPDKARSEFASGLTRDNKCFFCYDGLARVALVKGDLEEALRQTVAGLKVVHYNNGLLALLDTVLTRIGDPTRSIQVLQELAEQYPDDVIYLARLGWAQLFADRVLEAERSFRQALKRVPGYASAQAGLGRIQFRKTAIVREGWARYFAGEYEEALKAFEAKRTEAAAAGNPAAEDGRGWALLALGRGKEAMKAFRAALAIDDAFPYSRSGLIAAQRAILTRYNEAWTLLNQGRLEEAETAFRRARKEAQQEVPKEFHWLIDDGLAWVAYFRKNYDRAETAFQAILQDTPDAYLSRKGLGFVALARGKYEDALKALTASLTQNPYQVLSSYTLPATRLLEAKQLVKARQILELGERAYPRSADIQFMLARAYEGLEDKGKAAEKAVAAATLAPAYIHPPFDQLGLAPERVRDAYLAMGWGLYYAGNHEAALKRFEQYRKAGGTDPDAIRGLGWTLLALQKPEAAEQSFRKALRAGVPADAYLSRKGLGFVALARGEYEEALKALTASLTQNPNQDLSSYTLPATRLLEVKQFVKARQVLELGERAYPRSADIQFMLARAYEGLKDKGKAAEKAVAAATLAPAYIHPAFDQLNLDPARVQGAYLAMGWGLYFAGNQEAALERFEQYRKAGGTDPNAIRGRGFARFRVGQYEEAIADLKYAVQFEPKRLMPIVEAVSIPGVQGRWTITYSARSTLAWTYYRVKQPERAEVEFRKVLEDFPMWVDALTGLGYCRLAQGDKRGAAENFRKALQINPSYPDARRGLSTAERTS